MRKIVLLASIVSILSFGMLSFALEVPEMQTNSDYTVCMDYCMGDNHGFTHCHGECKGLATPVQSIE